VRGAAARLVRRPSRLVALHVRDRAFAPDRLLADRSRLDTGELTIEAAHTPVHGSLPKLAGKGQSAASEADDPDAASLAIAGGYLVSAGRRSTFRDFSHFFWLFWRRVDWPLAIV
jgi:hypothetical protein